MIAKKNNVETVLKKAGYKITRPRLLVLDFLTKSKQPVSVKEIIKNIGAKKIDQVTVYRILEHFWRDGLVKKIDFQTDTTYFELRNEKKDHHHVVCLSCKKVKDFTGCQSQKIIQKVLKTTPGFATITHHSFELFGICSSCLT